MHKLYILALVFSTILISLLITQPSHAISPNVVISQVQAGASGGDDATTKEFISVYNNSDQEVDISNWCLTNKSNLIFACFTPSAINETLHLPSYKYATISSDSFAKQLTYTPDVLYPTTNRTSGSIVAGSDSLALIDTNGVIVDGVSWSTSLSGGSTLERQFVAGSTEKLIDTDSMADFHKVSTLVVPASDLEEWITVDVCLNLDSIQDTVPDGYTVDGNGNCNLPPVDVCPNLDDLQMVVPNGYLLDSNDDCQPDICLNLDGLQMVLPNGMEFDASGNCVQRDECSNLSGIQTAIPDDYKRGNANSCILDLLPLKITEILPNAIGSDEGNEFIEIYNPNNSDVDLINYILYIGTNNVKFNFPIDSRIGAGKYLTFSNNGIKFTLVNTTSSVMLSTIDETLIDETPAYTNPSEGMTWALIDDVWQYTNRPTPGSANAATIIEPENTVVLASNLVPCAINQYRSLETNRCRLIATNSSTLMPCKDDQYRSEETNRCRNIASSSSALTPCTEGQVRNPDTNRCRSTTSVLGASDLVPCKVGQERNPETNRCRNVASAMPQAEYKPEQANESVNNYIIWWSLAAVGVVAIIYGLWEWRQEITGLIKKIRINISGKT